ncbi:hypothetical protein C8R44DRAFT_973914 [Mycena epipterygia]|nr:hypothetical protein C8R44DRAFT_973914 [Mycena epipterygia]
MGSLSFGYFVHLDEYMRCGSLSLLFSTYTTAAARTSAIIILLALGLPLPRVICSSRSYVSYDSVPHPPSICAAPGFTKSIPSRPTPNPYQYSASAPNGSHHRASSHSLSSVNFLRWYPPALEHQPRLFDLSSPAEYSFAPPSSFLSQFIHHIPKSLQLTQYTYRPSTRRHTRSHSLGASEEEDARFPIASGLAFSNAIPTTTLAFYCTRDTPVHISAVPPATQSASRVGISAVPGAKVGMGMPPIRGLGALALADISAPPPMGDTVDSAPNLGIDITHTPVSPLTTPISLAAYVNPMLRGG